MGLVLAVVGAAGPLLVGGGPAGAAVGDAWFRADGTTAEEAGRWPALTWSGAPGYAGGAPGRGSAFRFDGTNGLRSPDPTLGDLPTGPFTVQLAVRTTQVPPPGTVAGIASKGSPTGDHWQVVLRPDGTVAVELQVAGQPVVVTSPAGLADGSWHTIVVERAGELCVTVDGRRTTEGCAAVADAPLQATGPGLELGDGNPAIGVGAVPFVGLVDELYIGASPLVDLRVEPGPAPAVPPGGRGHLQVVLHNPSPAAVPAVARVAPPPGVRFVGIAPAPPCRLAAGGVVCDDGAGGSVAFPPGATTVTVAVAVDAGASPGPVAALVSWARRDAPDLDDADNIAVPAPVMVIAAPPPPEPPPAPAPVPPPAAPTPPAPGPVPLATPTGPPPSPPPGPSAGDERPAPIPDAPPAPAPGAEPAGPRLPSGGEAGAGGPTGDESASDQAGRGPRRGGGDPPFVVRSPDGTSDGPAGVGLRIAGEGYGRCDWVHLFLDDTRIGATRPDRRGRIAVDGISVPGDTPPGRHTVTTSCDRSGRPVIHSATFLVRDERWHRSGWVTALPRPDQVDWGLRSLLTSLAGAVAVVALVGFPAQLFNKTLDAHYDEVRRWFGRERPPRELSGWARAAVIAGFFALGALAHALLDPSFSLDAASVPTFVGRLASLLVVLAAFSIPALWYMRTRHGERGRLRVRPGTVALALLLAVVSRALRLHPGYLYGLLAGFVFGRELHVSAKGRLAAGRIVFVLVASLAAWGAWSAVADLTSRGSPSPALLVLESVLASLFVGGLLTATFGLLPVGVFDGSHVFGWRRAIWALELGAAAFAFIHVLLRPGQGYVAESAGRSTAASAVAFLAFGAVSVGFWAYFRHRGPHRDRLRPIEATPDATRA